MSKQTKTNDNMGIWDAVKQTDPRHTKAVKIGRGFTAIDAQYIVQRATEQFGPIGKGWGWHANVDINVQVKAVVAQVIVWHGTPEQSFGPFTSIQPLLSNNGRLDTDAGKKATTDALTKCLSHLGFGADVFLGLFDDNKYVQQLKEDFSVGPLHDMDDDGTNPEFGEKKAEERVKQVMDEDL